MLRRVAAATILLAFACGEAGVKPWRADVNEPAVLDTPGFDLPHGEYEPPDGFEIVFIDVGQGDAVLARFPNGSTMLVDGGGKSAGKYAVLPYFEQIGLTHLDYIVVTHPDADHCGGLKDVVLGVYVGELWENGQTNDTLAWWDFSDAVDFRGVHRQTVHRGDETQIDGCSVEVLNADQGWGDTNGNSIVLSVDCEGVTVLLTGDAHAGTQEYLVQEYGADLESDVLKVPHHGSSDRFSEFPSHVQPWTAICSVGAGNSYGHPDSGVVEEWEAAGANFVRTDEAGTVTITAKAGELEIETEY